MRCTSCMTLNAVGDGACVQCGAALQLEIELAPTARPCPRGCGALSAVADVLECVHCGGLFITHQVLADLVARHRTEGVSIRPPDPAPDRVTYLPCPVCNARMNRTVFGKSSGVIVDACRLHGTWFDARELTASLAFVERGGLELVAKREAARRAERERERRAQARVQELVGPPIPVAMGDTDAVGAEALSGLVELLLSL